MVEFNPDGSIKLPAGMAREKKDFEDRMRIGRCIHIKREVVNKWAPKKCVLHIRVSDKAPTIDVMTIPYRAFVSTTTTPTKFIKTSEKEARVEIGSEFRRCSDCDMLIKRLGEQFEGNSIIDEGNCETRRLERDFCEEDYFD